MSWKNRLIKHLLSPQFIKFCIVGGTSALINFVFYISLTELFGLWYVFSSIIGFVASAIFNFTANKFWTFRNGDNGKNAVIQLIKFFTVTVSGLLIHTILIYLITDIVGFDYRLSWIIATGVVTLWNYTFNKLWTFKVKSEKLKV